MRVATLSQLLAIPELNLRLVQAGAGDPEVSWASTTELLDLGAYLEGGELVLTTGLALDGGDARWRDLVAGLSRAQVAAIGFGIGVNHDRIPAPLVAACSTYRVALIEVPPPVPFVAVSKAVAGLLRADEVRGVRRAMHIHQRLLDRARGPQTTADVLASIAQATGRQLAVVGGDGVTLASTAGFGASVGDPGEAERIPLEVGTDRDGRSAAHLVITAGEPLSPESRAVVTAGAMVLGLELRGERNADQRERARWARLTGGLLDGRFSPEAIHLLDPEQVIPERVRALAVQGPAEDLGAWRRAPRAGFGRLIAPTEPGTHGTALTWQLCDDHESAVARALDSAAAHGLDVVVGRPAPISEAHLSRRSAAARVDSLSTVAQLYVAPRTPVVVWAEHSAPLLETLASDRQVAALGRAVLGALSEAPAADSPAGRAARLGVASPGAAPALAQADLPDAERRSLRITLRTLLAHHGQRGPAAAELGIHRNTLRDRVRRIEEITGRSLAHPDDRAELWLALRLEESR